MDSSTAVLDALAARGLALLPNDPVAAWQWLEQAAVRWHPTASTACARLLSHGIVVPRDAIRAWHFASFAAIGGDVEAAHLASRLAASGEVPGVGDVEAWHWIEAAKSGKHPWAYYDIAWAYENGRYGLALPGAAFYWYSVAAAAGVHEAYLRLGRLWLTRLPLPECLPEAREYFAQALRHGVTGAQEALDALPARKSVPRAFDEALQAHGNLRDVFDAADAHRGPQAWASVFEPLAGRLAAARPYFEQLRDAPSGRCDWPDSWYGELVDLYCASRLNDLMLMPFQQGEPSGDEALVDLTVAQYIDVWGRLGFTDKVPERFHPFWCEIVAVEQDDAATGIELVEVLWPAIQLGAMLFSRAGVRVRAPASVLAPDVATVSTLFWAWRRRDRHTADPSDEKSWDERWDAEFRRDYELHDRYAYNVDVMATDEMIDLRAADWNDCATPRLSQAQAIDLLRFRCITRHVIDNDLGLDPYRGFFEEPKDVAACATAPNATSSRL
jgi:hypothetical protein